MKNKGFTLVELLVVILIISLLAALLLPALQKARRRAHYASWCGLKQSNKNDPNCAGYWTFEEGTGSDTAANLAYGYTGNLIGHTAEDCDGTIVGATWIPPGDEGGRFLAKPSLSFDGNDYVDCGNDASLNITDAITIEAWIYWRQSTEAYNSVVAKESSGAGYTLLLKSNQKLALYFSGGSNPDNIDGLGAAVPLNQWVHIAGTRNAGTIATYINGTLDYSKSTSGTWGGSTAALWIGKSIYGSGRYFNGVIDEVAIFDVALSADEIKKRYQAGRP